MDALLRRRAMIAAGGGSPTPPGPVIEPVFYDYLVFDGTAYIDTNYTPGANDSYRVSLGNETLKAAQRVFFIPASNFTGMIYGGNTSSSSRQLIVYYGSSSYLATKNLSFNYDSFGFFLTPKNFGYGDSSTSITKGSGTPTGPLVFGDNPSHTSGQSFTGRMGIFYVYGSDAQNVNTAAGFDNYTPVATFRPCTYNGEAGMWYVEGNAFYGNTAGAGTLTVLNNS